jgi:hypothetical protein
VYQYGDLNSSYCQSGDIAILIAISTRQRPFVTLRNLSSKHTAKVDKVGGRQLRLKQHLLDGFAVCVVGNLLLLAPVPGLSGLHASTKSIFTSYHVLVKRAATCSRLCCGGKGSYLYINLWNMRPLMWIDMNCISVLVLDRILFQSYYSHLVGLARNSCYFFAVAPIRKDQSIAYTGGLMTQRTNILISSQSDAPSEWGPMRHHDLPCSSWYASTIHHQSHS